MMDFEVFESGGGSLTLLVYDAEGEVVYLHTEYEFSPGLLLQDLAALDAGEDPTAWDGNELEEYPGEQALGPWGDLIADNWGLYPDKMGASGLYELVEDKDIHCIPKRYVLIDHGHTRKEAEMHLENGTRIFTPQDWVQFAQDMCAELGDKWNDLYPVSPDEMLRLCQKGEYKSGWVESGLFNGYDELPYVIEYVC